MVVPRSSLMRTIRSRKRSLATRSRPIVGSSRNSTSGWCSMLATSSQRIRWPSDSVAHRPVEQVSRVQQLAQLGDAAALLLGGGIR